MDRWMILADRADDGFEHYWRALRGKLKQSPSREEIIQKRLEYAKILLSVWSHAGFSDGRLQRGEDDLVGDMVGALFEQNSLFPPDMISQEDADAILQELIQAFESPLPMDKFAKDIKKLKDEELSAHLYEDAVSIAAVDGKVEKSEKAFLVKLADALGLSSDRTKHIDELHIKKK
ncbi:MAG: TerB family tellurite resistance protein [Spirochaetia bacterium]|nr:TerB family tellurite resistance protein [Spirochaetia bacterium]